MMDKSILATEALRIKENDAAQHILKMMRTDALESLATVDPTEADAIREHQATVKVIDEFFARLDTAIREGAARTPAGLA